MSLKRRFEEQVEHDQKHASHNQDSDEHRQKRHRTTKKQTRKCEKCGTMLSFWHKNVCGECKPNQENRNNIFYDGNENQHFDTDFGDSIVSEIFNAPQNFEDICIVEQSQVWCTLSR